jgi:predicted nuclease of predicted toxin-antitoxin system
MWLLDHNLPRQLAPILQSLGIGIETTLQRGWERLSNGDLVGAAAKAGFTCILTRDVGFIHSADKALKKFPHICVVWITLPQQRGPAYAKTFQEAWTRSPIVPAAGELIRWPIPSR